mmetsp:Transcript_102333/g.176744  ORF Transcript_102333/g.176744 Transcript_102333/m.176744 type:complete len:222 (-) Transcript_102333:537-1202(-)
MHGWWLLVLLAWLTAAKKKPEVLYADVPFLECNVCKEAVSNVHQIATSVRRSQGKVREDDMFELTETLCDPKGKAGKWLTMYDVQLEAGGLKMVNKNKQGHCKKECHTLAYACRKHIEEIHAELAEALYLQKPNSLDKLKSRVCKKWTKACQSTPQGPVPDGRNDETWKEMDKKALEMEELMAKMESAGLGGMSMYSRDDMDEMMERGPEGMAEMGLGDEF